MNMKRLKILIIMLLSIALINTLIGCTIRATHHKSSVVQYLYPNKKEYKENPSIPLLSLPLKVGAAFVPETLSNHQNFTEKDRMELMKEISSHFKKYDFVKSIDLIPSAYLTPKGGFENLDQIHTMYGIDVIALISYDQTQFTDEGFTSIAYWTLIGAYMVRGEKNDTHTMVDTSVYDIKSRKMLFRAPGISHIKSKATPINLSKQIRTDSLNGFKEASKDLVAKLDEELVRFREKIKEEPQDIKVIHKPGYTGGGSVDASFLILIVVISGIWLWELKRRKR